MEPITGGHLDLFTESLLLLDVSNSDSVVKYLIHLEDLLIKCHTQLVSLLYVENDICSCKTCNEFSSNFDSASLYTKACFVWKFAKDEESHIKTLLAQSKLPYHSFYAQVSSEVTNKWLAMANDTKRVRQNMAMLINIHRDHAGYLLPHCCQVSKR